jgi:nucleotide-binding universal stress UspA family protein
MEFHKILIAIDNEPAAEMIALNGLQLAQQYHAEIALVSIIDPPGKNIGEMLTPVEIGDMIDQNCTGDQRNVIDKVFKDYPVTRFVEYGDPAEAIIRVAEQWCADVIVLGTHGRKGLAHLLIGSVAEEVVRHSKKMVVIIPILPVVLS